MKARRLVSGKYVLAPYLLGRVKTSKIFDREVFPLPVIKPTCGRVVWYWAKNASDQMHDAKEQPFAAQIVFVHDERRVNLAYYDHNGNGHQAHNVVLLQGDDAVPSGPAAQWMPVQSSGGGFDKRIDALESKLRDEKKMDPVMTKETGPGPMSDSPKKTDGTVLPG